MRQLVSGFEFIGFLFSCFDFGFALHFMVNIEPVEENYCFYAEQGSTPCGGRPPSPRDSVNIWPKELEEVLLHSKLSFEVAELVWCP